MYSTYSVSTELKLCTTLRTLEQCHSVCSLYQQQGHHRGASEKCRISGPIPDPLHQQEEWVCFPSDLETCFKAGTGKAQDVCAENTPARALPRWSRGLGGGDRGLPIFKKLHSAFELTFWLRIHPFERL